MKHLVLIQKVNSEVSVKKFSDGGDYGKVKGMGME